MTPKIAKLLGRERHRLDALFELAGELATVDDVKKRRMGNDRAKRGAACDRTVDKSHTLGEEAAGAIADLGQLQ